MGIFAIIYILKTVFRPLTVTTKQLNRLAKQLVSLQNNVAQHISLIVPVTWAAYLVSATLARTLSRGFTIVFREYYSEPFFCL